MVPSAVAVGLYEDGIFKRSKISLQLINLAAQWSGRVENSQTKQLLSVFDLSQPHVLCGMQEPVNVATFFLKGVEMIY